MASSATGRQHERPGDGTSGWLYLPEVVEFGRDVSRSVDLFHRVNQQDFAACERCQPAMDSRLYRDGGVLVPSEHHLGAFHDWLRVKLAV